MGDIFSKILWPPQSIWTLSWIKIQHILLPFHFADIFGLEPEFLLTVDHFELFILNENTSWLVETKRYNEIMSKSFSYWYFFTFFSDMLQWTQWLSLGLRISVHGMLFLFMNSTFFVVQNVMANQEVNKSS